jgi:hypothetical protein
MKAALLFLVLSGCSKPASLEKWGIVPLSLRPTMGGALLDFRYQVVDAKKAAPLFDRKLKPYLVVDGTRLSMPEDSQLGALRASLRNPPVAGKSYYVLFGSGNVKRGSRVTVMFGPCQLDGVKVD